MTSSTTLNKKEVLTAVGEEIKNLQQLMSPLDEKQANTVPYKDSWTAAQLFRHIIKSNEGLAKAIHHKGQPAARAGDEKVSGLRNLFLDFVKKMESPDFIIPEPGPYQKDSIVKDLDVSFEHFKTEAEAADLSELVEGLPFGEVTKLEILHFVLYHTQRHVHQMRKICDVFTSGH